MPFQMRYFDEGRREPFFSSWQQYVPASSLNYDLMTQKVAAIKGALLRAFHVFDAQRTSLFYLACRSLNSACIYIFLSIPHSQAPQVRGVWIRTLQINASHGAVPCCLPAVLVANPGGERGASPAGGMPRQQDLALRMKDLKTFLETRGAGLAHSGGGHQSHSDIPLPQLFTLVLIWTLLHTPYRGILGVLCPSVCPQPRASPLV